MGKVQPPLGSYSSMSMSNSSSSAVISSSTQPFLNDGNPNNSVMNQSENYQQSMQKGYESFSLTTRRRHHPQASGHSSSSIDIWKRPSQFGPDMKQAQLPTSSPKVLGRSQSTDSINELAESLLMEVSSNKAMDEESQTHPSRDYFAPLPQMSHQSGNSMYSTTNGGGILNHSTTTNGDVKSMVIMPNLQPNRYQMQPH